MTVRRPRFMNTGAARFGMALSTAMLVAGCATAPPPRPDSVVLPAAAAFPEAMTAAADGSLFVSSITQGGVTRIPPGSTTAVPFIQPGEHGTRSTFGLYADDKRGTLWVLSNDASSIGIKGPGNVAGGWIKGFDLKTGAPKASAQLPGPKVVGNDVAIAEDGTLYITNSAAPQILRLKPGATEVEVFVQDERLKGGLDGIAIGKDGNLYVNTFVSGEMFRIAVDGGAAGPVTKLKTEKALTRPDGLRPYKGGFIMVEGGGPLNRVTIDGDKASFTTLAMLAEPTSLWLTADRIWVSEGHLSYLGPERKGELPESFRLRSMPLPQN